MPTQVEPARGGWQKFPAARNAVLIGVKDKFCLYCFGTRHIDPGTKSALGRGKAKPVYSACNLQKGCVREHSWLTAELSASLLPSSTM